MTEEQFDGIAYLRDICSKNRKMQAEGHYIGVFSGERGVEPLMEKFRKQNRFCLICDTSPEAVTSNRAGGYFNHRLFTLLVIQRYKDGDMAAYEAARRNCRCIITQVISRIIKDFQDGMRNNIYLNRESITLRDSGPQQYNGATGTAMVLMLDEPIDLTYDNEQWE